MLSLRSLADLGRTTNLVFGESPGYSGGSRMFTFGTRLNLLPATIGIAMRLKYGVIWGRWRTSDNL